MAVHTSASYVSMDTNALDGVNSLKGHHEKTKRLSNTISSEEDFILTPSTIFDSNGGGGQNHGHGYHSNKIDEEQDDDAYEYNGGMGHPSSSQKNTTATKLRGRRRNLRLKTLVELIDATYITSFSFFEWTRVVLFMTIMPAVVGVTIFIIFTRLFGSEWDDEDDTTLAESTVASVQWRDWREWRERRRKLRASQSRREKILSEI